MATKRYRPGRTVVAFFVGLAIAFGLVALGGAWKPELGLDLQGGTRITLIANGSPSKSSLTEAAGIIDQRVNGSGVTEAEVNTQSNQFVVVEIPGRTRQDLVDTVKRQAQLRFRLVACTTSDGKCGGAPTTTPGTGSTLPGTGVTLPPGSGESQSSGGGTSSGKSGGKAGSKGTSGNNRPPAFVQGTKHHPKKSSASPSSSPSASSSASPSPTGSPTSTTGSTSAGSTSVQDALAWMDAPDQAAIDAFNQYQCGKTITSNNVDSSGKLVPGDDPTLPMVTCGDDGQKYLLSAAPLEGTQLTGANAGIPQNDVSWAVNLKFNGEGSSEFAQISKALYGTEKQFAIVLDGKVISAPQMNGVITNGEAQITGKFSETEAQSLATSLKFGALPISFQKDPQVEIVGPSLAGNQLSAGVTAGILGLILVMLYCLLYYRGLGTVVIASLVVAGLATYAMVLLLSKTAGFTLTLPGIAGLIVAVGITADSFIVFFERIRDEMREGRSMRAAVEAGWVRARNTCLAADAVSLLAAVVLYIFAAGVVKGFAFALGLSTIIDLAVFFWFTHPMVSWLARFPFFNKGHKLSGLDRENLGLAPVGGKA
jgi:preprotein translocase subunit SecD